MDKEASKIARHHLGDALASLARGGPHGDDWIVSAFGDGGAKVSARAPTVDAAAADCAAQLRAAGWSPSHARLEWRSSHGDHELRRCIDHHAQVLFSAEEHWKTGKDGQTLYHLSDVHDDATISLWQCPAAEVFEYIAEWCATNLPSLHLPPFPETPHA
mgnify:CR=1 FL=1